MRIKTVVLSLSIILGSSLNYVKAHETQTIQKEIIKPTISPMLKKVMPSVVSVSVEGTTKYRQKFPDFLKHFLDNNIQMPEEEEIEKPFKGIGSGVIFDSENGYIVTNSHVIEKASKITVTLNNGEEYEAKKIGEDKQTDIAVLQIDADNLIKIKFSDSDSVEVGDFVVAVGNPLGLSQTVTTGIVSALSRSGLSLGSSGIQDFIQTDAAINRGNSGGALVSWDGSLIGINTAIAGQNGGNIGIGFAIPSNMVLNLVNQIIEFGEVERGLLGIFGGNLNSQLSNALKLNTTKGAFIREVINNSAADQAGIKAGDVITVVDGKRISSFDELRARIGSLRSGSTINITFLRDNKEIETSVILGQSEPKKKTSIELDDSLKGVEFAETEEGVFVKNILSNSYAERAGLSIGDLIISINKEPVKNIKQMKKILEESGKVYVFKIQGKESQSYIVMQKLQ